jgi:hypothetical protein
MVRFPCAFGKASQTLCVHDDIVREQKADIRRLLGLLGSIDGAQDRDHPCLGARLLRYLSQSEAFSAAAWPGTRLPGGAVLFK